MTTFEAVERLRELREDPEYVRKEFDNHMRRLRESKDKFFVTPLKFKNTSQERIRLNDCNNYDKNQLK